MGAEQACGVGGSGTAYLQGWEWHCLPTINSSRRVGWERHCTALLTCNQLQQRWSELKRSMGEGGSSEKRERWAHLQAGSGSRQSNHPLS